MPGQVTCFGKHANKINQGNSFSTNFHKYLLFVFLDFFCLLQEKKTRRKKNTVPCTLGFVNLTGGGTLGGRSLDEPSQPLRLAPGGISPLIGRRNGSLNTLNRGRRDGATRLPLGGPGPGLSHHHDGPRGLRPPFWRSRHGCPLALCCRQSCDTSGVVGVEVGLDGAKACPRLKFEEGPYLYATEMPGAGPAKAEASSRSPNNSAAVSACSGLWPSRSLASRGRGGC
jgi:hypothetical protein